MSKECAFKNVLKFLRYGLFLFALWFFLCAKLTGSLNTLLFSTQFLFLTGLFYCLEDFRQRVVLFFFYVAFFVFLLSRPTISMLRGNVWWYYGEEGCHFALNLIFISLMVVYLCAIIFDSRLRYRQQDDEKVRCIENSALKSDFNFALCRVSMIGYYICFVFNFIQGLEKLAFVLSGQYSDIYVGFQSSLPFLVRALGSLMPYFLCIYLASLPEKPSAFIALFFYIISALPTFLLGARNSLVLAVIFSLVYFVLRDYTDKKRRWIGKFEKICLIVAIPIGIAFLGYYNYFRDGIQVENSGFFALIVDFFYKQGVSFDVMSIAYNVRFELPDEVSKCYTFGGMIDYLKTNIFAQKLLGAIPFEDGNSIFKAIYGNSFAHSLAYIAEPNYLSGHGLGSSYLLETYFDFGYVGVGLFSVLISGFMSHTVPFFKKSVMARIFVLNCLMSFFLIARAEATGWLNFILYAQFWAVMIFCYISAHMTKDDYVRISSKYYKVKRVM